MNGYDPSTPRTALGLAAAAMTAITLGAFVLLPAGLESAGADTLVSTPSLAAATATFDAVAGKARSDAPGAADRQQQDFRGAATQGPHESRGKRQAGRSRSHVHA